MGFSVGMSLACTVSSVFCAKALRDRMMKSFGIAIGLAAVLGAGSASASVVYDTITGITNDGSPVKINANAGFTPMGDHFKASTGEDLISVTVQLFAAGTSGTGNLTDSGSVIVYLVPGVNDQPNALTSSNSAATIPPNGCPAGFLTSCLTLKSPIYLGTILDTSVAIGTTTNLTVTPTNAIYLTKGNWWIVLASGADPNNFYQTMNPVESSAKWERQLTATALAEGAIGIPAGGANSVRAIQSNPGGPTGLIEDPNHPDDVFLMQISAPEPASLAILGVGLLGLGINRHRRGKKPSA
jgi:hypothetical protein